ncbi:MAG: transaldolase [Actinomycetota bacterium]|nr:transaldolase [Actinomycetota bacterium]MDQ1294685.1 transaldolase [Actinomycetota bacterium]
MNRPSTPDPIPPGTTVSAVPEALSALVAEGVSVWLDDLSRELLESGELVRLMAERAVVGLTSNPTIFATALLTSELYRGQLVRLVGQGASVRQAVEALTCEDVRRACDVLREVHRGTAGRDGFVSLEVSPALARDTAGTLVEARRLWARVDRPNLMIKIPATPEGLPAITTCLAEGINVNATLIFSVERYRQVHEAALAGLEQAAQRGTDLSGLASVASFFVSRLDTEIDRRLSQIGTPQALELRGRAALATARSVHRAFRDTLASARWRALAEAGARPQRPLWASTGVKDPAYPDTLYVTGLVARDTVNTLPRATLEAFADHGEVPGEQVPGGDDDAAEVLDRLDRLGLDRDAVAQVLSDEGVAKFQVSWDQLVRTVSDGLARIAATDSDEEAGQ